MWRRAASALGTSTAPALGNQPSRTVAAWSGSPDSSRAVASISSSTTVARRMTTRPAAVSRTPSRRRSSNSAPAARSIEAICRDTADWVYPSDPAAAVKVPCSATARNTRSAVSDTSVKSMTFTHTMRA